MAFSRPDVNMGEESENPVNPAFPILQSSIYCTSVTVKIIQRNLVVFEIHSKVCLFIFSMGFKGLGSERGAQDEL